MGCAQECTQANDAVIVIMAGQVKQLHYLIASLAAVAQRGSRLVATYFVVARRRKACQLTPPQQRRAIRVTGSRFADCRSSSGGFVPGVALVGSDEGGGQHVSPREGIAERVRRLDYDRIHVRL